MYQQKITTCGAEMEYIYAFLSLRTRRSLVFVDELGWGTSPIDVQV